MKIAWGPNVSRSLSPVSIQLLTAMLIAKTVLRPTELGVRVKSLSS